MGILSDIKTKVTRAADVVHEKYDAAVDTLEDKETEMWKRHEDRVEAKRQAKELKQDRVEAKRRAKELKQDTREIEAKNRRTKREADIAAREAAGISPKRVKELRKESGEQYESDITPTPQKVWAVTKKVAGVAGGILVSGSKTMMTDGHGRSGKRATKEWRRENRDYQSEARKARAGAASPSVFNSITMFGQNKIPVRSRYRGANEIGTSTDPLSNWSSSIMGSAGVRQDTTIEGSVRKGMQKPPKQPRTQSPTASLGSFAKSLGGNGGKKKGGKKGGGLAGFGKMIGGF